MSKIVTILLTQLASLASVLGLYFSISAERPSWHFILLGIVIALAIFVTVREVYDVWRSRPKTFRTAEKVDAYMKHWVLSGGQTVIFSRDMSWAGEDDIRNPLIEKAKRDELTVFVERPLPITDELVNNGARVFVYRNLGHVPSARFTIVDFGHDGARVAVGVMQDGNRIVEEYQRGHHPFYAVAEDMVRFLLVAADEVRIAP